MIDKPYKSYTIEEFIQYQGVSKLNYEDYCLHEKESFLNIISYNILDDYLDELKLISKTIELSDTEYIKYLYKPRILAYDIYGDPELFFIILKLNNLCSSKEFNLKKLKLIPKDTLLEILSIIYNSEKNVLQRNSNTIIR